MTVQAPGKRSRFRKIKFAPHLTPPTSLCTEICDLGVIGFVAYKGGIEPHGGYIRNINCETRGKLIGIGSRRVVCNADFLETRSGRIMNNHN